MKNKDFEVGIYLNGEWVSTLLENASYDEAVKFCLDYDGDKILWLYDTMQNANGEYYQHHEQIIIEE